MNRARISGALAGLLALPGSIWLGIAAAATGEREWLFDVFLDDKPIGYHRFSLTPDSAGQQLRSEARFKVSVLKIPVYRYAHEARETWSNGCLTRIESTTDDNGEQLSVRGREADVGFIVESGEQRRELDHCVMSFAYWDTRILEADRLLNAQNGEYLDVEVQALGEDALVIAGAAVAAQRYRLTGKNIAIDLWYSPDRDWVGLQSETPSGRILSYRRQVQNDE